MAAFFTQIQTPGKPKLVYRVGVKDYPELTLESLKETAPRRVPVAARRRSSAARAVEGRQADDQPQPRWPRG